MAKFIIFSVGNLYIHILSYAPIYWSICWLDYRILTQFTLLKEVVVVELAKFMFDLLLMN